MQHISSKRSLDAATAKVLLAAANLDDGGLGALGSDLASVAGLLGREASLRRNLSEATTDVQARTSMMSQLLAGKIGTPAMSIVDFVVRQDWATSRDLADAIAQLGRTAMFLRAERSGELDDIEDQLFRFGRIVNGAPELSVLLDDPTITTAARASLVGRLLAGRAHPLTIELLDQLARDTGPRSFTHGVDELIDQAAQRRDRVVAIVETAIELSGEQTERLTAALGRIYARPVSVHVLVAPELGGGMRVRVGDEVIDGSVAGRLDELRRKLG